MEYVNVAAFILGSMPWAPTVICGTLLALTATMNLKKRGHDDEDSTQH